MMLDRAENRDKSYRAVELRLEGCGRADGPMRGLSEQATDALFWEIEKEFVAVRKSQGNRGWLRVIVIKEDILFCNRHIFQVNKVTIVAALWASINSGLRVVALRIADA